jgi:glycosyltransferase involved in cell wall biosynthesis
VSGVRFQVRGVRLEVRGVKKHILYVSTTLPTPGFGSSVILYRHLKRLKDWRVTILVDDDSAAERYELPKEWRIIKTGERRWWWPPVKKRIPGLLNLRLGLLRRTCARALNSERPSAILTQLGRNSLLAYRLSLAWRIPLSVIVHDKWQVWSKYGGADRYLDDNLAASILNHASRVWPVSLELANSYSIRDADRVRVLYPMPEGNIGGFARWRDDFKTHPVIGFAGSFHTPQLKDLKAAVDALRSLNGKLFIISKSNETIKSLLKDCPDIEYTEPLPENSQAITYLKDTVSCILISGSIDQRAQGWQYSFPSRLVEFMHLGVPMIITAMPGTVLSNWAKRHNWLAYAEDSGGNDISEIVRRITEKESWEKMADESRAVALGEFNPERIQAQFEGELVTA